jgi:hypothetical protein
MKGDPKFTLRQYLFGLLAFAILFGCFLLALFNWPMWHGGHW